MDGPTATIVGALVGFIGGLVAARVAQQQKADELFFKALDFLGGGSQKRNLGIAAIELYWSNKRHRAISVSLLVGSALYLLLQSEQEDATHELHNLDRIMTRLLQPDARAYTSRRQYERLLAGVRAAREPKRSAGLHVDNEQLEAWEQSIAALVRPS